MAKSWSDVAQSDAYLALPPAEQDAARQQYFTSVVAPMVPKSDRPMALEQFNADTAPKTYTAPDDGVSLGDATGSGFAETAAAPTNVPQVGGGRGVVNPPLVGESVPQSSGSTAEDMARNFRGGLLGTVAGAGATLASAAGLDNVAQSLDNTRQDFQQEQKEAGGDTIAGKTASVAGSVVPAFLLPASKAAQLIGNAGLFAIPAFRDTLNQKLEEGQSFPLALAHASEAFGLNLFMPTVATRGSGAVVKALGGAEAKGVAGAAAALGQAGAEGAAFSAANSALDKGTDLVAGQQNDKDWIDLKDMAANALGFSALRGAHVAPQAASAVADRAGSPSQQFGRALGQDVEAGQFDTTLRAPQANPNLANVSPDPIAKIADAQSVDDAIAATTDAVSANAHTEDDVAGILNTIRPLEPQPVAPTLEQELAALNQRKADVGADSGVAGEPVGTGVVGGTDVGAGVEPRGPVPDNAGGDDARPTGAPVVDSPSGVAEQPRAAEPVAPVAPRFETTDNPSGTVSIKGDPTQIRQKLGEAGITSTLTTKDGVTVGVSQAARARELFAKSDEPASVWFGRAGDGYKTEADATMAMPSRQRVAPELAWKIEPMPNGKFRLAGYAGDGAKSGDATAHVETPPAESTPGAESASRPDEAVDIGAGQRTDAERQGPGVPSVEREGETGRGSEVPPPDAVPRVTLNRDGTATVLHLGDKDGTRLAFKDAGISNYAPTEGGYVVGKSQAAKAEKLFAQPQEKARQPLSLGIAPGSAEPVTVKSGIVHVGKDEAINFDSGEPIRVRDGASDLEIKQALKEGGAVSRKAKFFGGSKESALPAEFTPENRVTSGYEKAAPEVKAEVNELVAHAESGGIELPRILADTAKAHENSSPFDHVHGARDAIADALTGSGEDRSGTAGEQARPEERQAGDEAAGDARDRSEHAQGLTSDHLAPAESFESIGKTGGPGPAGGKTARSQAQTANPFKAFIAKHGISIAERSEFAPGTFEQRKAMVPGYGPIFRRTGKPLDTLVQDAIEEGFLPRNEENGEPKLREMIAQALDGKRIIAQHAEGVVEAEAQAELKRREEMANEAASALEEVPDAALFHLTDEDIPWDTPGKQVDTATFLRALGASEEEIAHEVANETSRAQASAEGRPGDEEATRVAAQEPAASGAEEARVGDSALSSPTREDIVAQQDRAKAGERNAANADRVAAERNQADAERGDFKLTGSDRAADSNADQDRLFTKSGGITQSELDSRAAAIKEKYGLSKLTLSRADAHEIELSSIIVGKGDRGEGKGSAAMREISAMADELGLRVVLDPANRGDPFTQGTTSRARLVQFYKRFGFVENKGRNADFEISAGMYREPRGSTLETEGGSRPFAEFNKLQGKGGISEIAKRDAEKILGIKSPVPVLRRADHEAAANNSPMYYELGSKSIIYNTAYKNRTRAQDAQWMAEEIMHAIDHIEGKRTISLGSDTLKPGGELRQEVEKAMGRSGAIKNFLNYPLKFNISEDRKTVELFARLGVIFKGFPDLLRAAAPKTYEAYRAIFADTVPGEVRGQGRDAAADRQADQRPLSLGESRPDAGIGDQGEQTDSRLAGIRDRSVRALGSTAEGGVGDFRSDRLETRADTAPDDKPDEESKPQDSPGAGMLDGAKSFFAGIRDDLTNKIAPMSTGSQQARAAAQKFANDTRVARHQWQRLNEVIKAKFNPDERKAMWDAADEQNTLMQKGEPTEGKGLERLNDKQRAVMQQLHGYADSLWKRAQEVGMVEGNGLPFWTPRMAVMVGEDGSFSKPGGDGKTATSKGEGRNVMTSAPSAKHRKYVGTEESESALKGALGDNAQYVHDILTMPLAMSRFEQAIAGRELINQVKEIGLATGKETVASAGGPGFFTLDHPAFTTYKPRMTTDADGKTTALKDEAGNTVMDRAPLFISKEFEGPLKAVMSTRDGAVYSGYMLLKSKAMTVIMASPLTHNMVIYGRALAYSPLKVGTGYLYWKGHILGKDDALMRQAIGHGLVPLGANKNSMMDITDVARGLGREGGWGDPNESWVSLSLQKLGNALHEGAGDAIKAKADALGDFVHHTLLWKQVGAVQIGIYHDMYQYLAAKGYSDKAAGPLAAHFANRYAGAVANENMSELARKSANVLLFSRSFNMGNLGAMKDMAFGMSAGLKAKMMEDVGAIEGGKAMNFARRKAIASLLTETGFSVLAQSVVQSAVDKLKKDKSWDEISEGYKRRLASMFDNVSQHPFNPASYNPYQISPTFDNEPKKKDRISIGAQPGGREEYIRLPTGKVVEDMIGWATEPGDTFSKKMSPMAKAVWQDITNDKGYGIPVKDPEGGFWKHAYDLIAHVAEAQLPWDQVKGLYDLTQGKATDIDKDKLAGFATGFSPSQGHPGGAEAAVAAQTEERFNADKKYQMELIKRDLKYGDEATARDRMDKIGMTPHEQAQLLNRIDNPKTGLSRAGAKHFNSRANEEERKQMDLQR